MNQPSFDVLILGAGAAGLMAAIEAGRRGRRVAGPRARRASGQKNPDLRRRPLQLHQPAHRAGQFPFRQSPLREIGAGSLHARGFHSPRREARHRVSRKNAGAAFLRRLGAANCRSAHATNVRMPACACFSPLRSARCAATILPEQFTLFAGKAVFTAPALIVATGGLSIPKMGATGFGYDIARQFSIPVEPCRPALVPLTLSGAELAEFARPHRRLRASDVTCGKRSFTEKMLFTHRGLSGPAILQISSYWKKHEAIHIDWAPGQQLLATLRARNARRDPAAAKAALRTHLPARLADRLIDVAAPQSWTNHALDELERSLHSLRIHAQRHRRI